MSPDNNAQLVWLWFNLNWFLNNDWGNLREEVLTKAIILKENSLVSIALIKITEPDVLETRCYLKIDSEIRIVPGLMLYYIK